MAGNYIGHHPGQTTCCIFTKRIIVVWVVPKKEILLFVVPLPPYDIWTSKATVVAFLSSHDGPDVLSLDQNEPIIQHENTTILQVVLLLATLPSVE